MNLFSRFTLSEENIRQDIRSCFNIAEKDGSLYLTHQGDAFIKFEDTDRVSEVLRKLENARNSAINYKGYGTDPSESETAPV